MSNQKKIMLLGGIHYLLPVIKAGYLPDNVVHQYSNEYVKVSIIGKEYNAAIIPFTHQNWNIEETIKNSNSLLRMVDRLKGVAANIGE